MVKPKIEKLTQGKFKRTTSVECSSVYDIKKLRDDRDELQRQLDEIQSLINEYESAK